MHPPLSFTAAGVRHEVVLDPPAWLRVLTRCRIDLDRLLPSPPYAAEHVKQVADLLHDEDTLTEILWAVVDPEAEWFALDDVAEARLALLATLLDPFTPDEQQRVAAAIECALMALSN